MDITELQNNSSLAIFKPYNRLLKRMLDVLVSSVFLVCVYPWVYIVVACCIKISMPGKVMFTQKRTGKDGKTFVCYKFRTMRPNKEADTKQVSTSCPSSGMCSRVTCRSSVPGPTCWLIRTITVS